MNKVIKTNSVGVSYEMLSDSGENIKRKQTFNLVSYTATDEDFYEIGKAIGKTIGYGIKEISKNNVVVFTEA